MTDLIDRADSGDIHRPFGEERTRIYTMNLPGEVTVRIDTGENTQNLGRYAIHASVVGAIPRKTFDIDDTVVYHRDTVVYDQPPSIGVIPDPDTETISPLGSLTATPDGELRPAAPGPFPVPLPPTPPPTPSGFWTRLAYAGRHRLSWGERVRRLLAGMGVVGLAVVAIWAGLILAGAAVFL